ncbi:MAG: hypothetical protein IKX65_06390 [Prevotella sp.]|nr:hypothetical protein [Prevotella sp.]
MAKGVKTQIVLDADVVIHFAKGGLLSQLPSIFPDYEYVLLETVYQELKSLKSQVDNQIMLLKNITLLPFAPRGEMLREYAMLRSRFNFGKGESACMAYCLFTHNVIGSSNLRDIRAYCEENKITYLTTIDFLWHAWRKHLLTTEEVKTFISEVKSKGSILPDVDIEKYVCETIL